VLLKLFWIDDVILTHYALFYSSTSIYTTIQRFGGSVRFIFTFLEEP